MSNDDVTSTGERILIKNDEADRKKITGEFACALTASFILKTQRETNKRMAWNMTEEGRKV